MQIVSVIVTFFNCLAIVPIHKEFVRRHEVWEVPRHQLRGSPFLRCFPLESHSVCAIQTCHLEARSKSPETHVITSLLTVTCGDYIYPDPGIFVTLIHVTYEPFGKTARRETELDSKGKVYKTKQFRDS